MKAHHSGVHVGLLLVAAVGCKGEREQGLGAQGTGGMRDGGLGGDASPEAGGAGGGPATGGAVGSGGDSAGGNGGSAGARNTGGDAQPPAACTATTDRQPPFATRIRFQNDGGSTVYLRSDCTGLAYGISSCAAGFGDQVGPAYQCACSCSEASCTGSPACGPCPETTGVAVAPGAFKEAAWPATRVTQTPRATFSCLNTFNLPAARYRLAVNVYTSAAAAIAGGMDHLKVADFFLPAVGDVLTVSLAAADDLCDGSANAPTCPSASRDVACNLPGAFSWRWEGGLVVYSDAVQLAADANYTRTRTQSTTQAKTMCTTPVPRCSHDGRVVTTFDVARAFGDPDVMAALAMPGMLIYGADARAYDGSILIVSNGSGSLAIGAPCDPAAANNNLCMRAVPPGLAALQVLLGRLDTQALMSPLCAALAN